MEKKRIILTGGGTAGHIMPNLALIPHLEKHFEIHYVGEPNSLEEKLVKENAPFVTFHPLKSVKWVRGSILRNLLVPFKLFFAYLRARRLIKRIKPDIVFSKGGFVSLPICLACRKIPLILHESDYSLGAAHKMCLKKARVVCTSFSTTAKGVSKGLCTGAPLRDTIFSGKRSSVFVEGASSNKKNLLIIGGSLGARAINTAVSKNLEALTKRYNIVHIVGTAQNGFPEKRPGYKPLEFVKNIQDYFAWADICLTRGGANALFELVSLAIPSLVIPLPKGISRGDQILNAQYFTRLGCTHTLQQAQIEKDPSTLFSALTNLEQNAQKIKQSCKATPNIFGTKQIASVIKAAN